MDDMQEVWVFVGAAAKFPSGVFAILADAERWISKHSLTGVLTAYPVGIGVFDQAVEQGTFSPKNDRQRSPDFIGRFSSASQDHYHYEDGHRI